MAFQQSDVELGKALVAWRVALETGYITAPVWVPWAESRLLASDPVPGWLCDLYLAKEPEEALRAVSDALWSCVYRDGLSCPCPEAADSLDPAGLYFGFLFLRYKRGDFDAHALLKLSREKADTSYYHDTAAWAVFLRLFDELNGYGTFSPWEGPFFVRLVEAFAPFEACVRELLPLLEIGVTPS